MLKVTALALHHVPAANGQLFAPLLQLLIQLTLKPLVAIQATEKPKQSQQQDYCQGHGSQHPVQLGNGLVQLVCTGLQLPVLSSLFLKVQIEVSVIVTSRLVVDCSIGNTQLFTDTCHQVRGLEYALVLQRKLQVLQCGLVVSTGTIARSKCSIGTGNLVHVTVILEDIKRLFCQPNRQLLLVDALGIDELHARSVGLNQLASRLRVGKMLCQSLQGIRSKIRIVVTVGNLQATHQVIKLLLIDFLLGSRCDDSTGSNVIQVVEELCCVLFHLIRHLV